MNSRKLDIREVANRKSSAYASLQQLMMQAPPRWEGDAETHVELNAPVSEDPAVRSHALYVPVAAGLTSGVLCSRLGW